MTADSQSILVDQTCFSELRADLPRFFEFVAEPDKFYLVEVDQGGLDLLVTVKEPSGKSTTFNSPLLRDETELVLVNAGEAGPFEISLLSTEHSGVTAHISIHISEVSTEADTVQEKLDIFRLISEASAANYRGKLEGWNTALEAYRQAINLARKSGDDRLVARMLFSIAAIEYWQISNWDRSADLAARAAEIYRKTGQDRLAANAIHLKAAAIIEKANEVEKSTGSGLAPESKALFDEALSLFDQALADQERLGNPYDAALITNNIGLTYFYIADWDLAALHFHNAANQFRRLKEWGMELVSLSNLVAIDYEQGKLARAIQSVRRILELIPPDKRQRFRADQLDNLGGSLLAFGRLDEALQSFSAALEIQNGIDDIKGRGRSLAGIGITYYSIGERELALEFLKTALAARQKANDGRGQVSVLNFLGKLYRHEGSYPSALEAHFDALRLATTPIDQARIRVHLARDYVAIGNPDEALKMLEKAKAEVREDINQKLLADISQTSGDAWMQTRQYEASLAAFQKAADLYLSLGLDAERSRAVFGQARAARAQGRMTLAAEYAERAVSSVEQLRQQLIAPELRAFFLASRQDYYEFLIDTLMAIHQQTGGASDEYMRRALSVSERSRSRRLIDLISEASISLETMGNSGVAGRQTMLYQDMAENRYRLNRLIEKPDEPGTAREIAVIKQELADIENELNLLQIEIHEKNPGYARLTDPQILDAGQIQKMLDTDSALLQYSLGEESSYVWLVSSDYIKSWQLPGRATIEKSARKLYDLLKVPAFSSSASSELDKSISEVSSQILEPVGRLDISRLIVAADGVLHYLPFSILKTSAQQALQTSLLAGHEIVYLPSMSALAAQGDNHKTGASPTREIAVFADPVFSRDDSRMVVETSVSVEEMTGVEPQGALSSGPSRRLDRLPATAREAKRIAELVDSDQLFLALGFDATRESIINSALVDYRIIHFATHGLIDSRYPALSALAFSQFDEDGQPLNGFLRLHDFYNLRLNADLVTMSACQTALGREIAGEGLTGLTQGLMYSGSKSVLASLWQVPDRATSELMERFYRNLLQKKQRPATALRNAQLELSSRARWRSPYFWSAFVLQGDWQ